MWNTPVFKKVLLKYARNTEGKMKRILSENGKRNSRIYKLIKINTVVRNDNIEIISSLPDYAKFINDGRRPGKMPPNKDILDWCKRKGIDKKMVFPIQRKIGDKGIKGIKFLEPLNNFSQLLDEIKKITLNESLKLMREELKK